MSPQLLLTSWCLMASLDVVTGAFTGVADNCYLTMIVPRDKIKNTCLAEENLRKRIVSLEGRISQFRDRVTQQEIRLINQHASQEKVIKRVDEKIEKLTRDISKIEKSSRVPNYFNMGYMGRSATGKSKPDPKTPQEIIEKVPKEYRFSKSGRNDKVRTSRSRDPANAKRANIVSLELLKPYIDGKIQLLNEQLNSRIDGEVKPIAKAFELVKNAAVKPDSQYATSFRGNWVEEDVETTPQVRTNTLALSQILPEMTRIQEVLFELSEKQSQMRSKIAELEVKTLEQLKNMASEKKSLEVRVAELEGENNLLKLNESLDNRFTRFRLEMVNEFSKFSNRHLREYQNDRQRARMVNDNPSTEDHRKNIEAYMKNVIPNGDLSKTLRTVLSNLSKVNEFASVNLKATASLSKRFETLEKQMRGYKKEMAIMKNVEVPIVKGNVELLSNKLDKYSGEMDDSKSNLRSLKDDVSEIRSLNDGVMSAINVKMEKLNASIEENRRVISNVREMTNKVPEIRDNVEKINLDHSVKMIDLNSTLRDYYQRTREVLRSLEANVSSKHAVLNSKIAFVRRTGVAKRFDLLKEIKKLNTTEIARNGDTHKTLESGISQLHKSIKNMYNELGDMRLNTLATKNDLIAKIDDLEGKLTVINLERRLDIVTWVQYNFTSSDGVTKCNGRRYIKIANVSTPRLIVGVVLCSASRYKIFLASRIDDIFLGVGDSDGFGEAHCSLVGGKSVRPPVKNGDEMAVLTAIEGYEMNNVGDVPKKKKLDFLYASPSWYECGVTVP